MAQDDVLFDFREEISLLNSMYIGNIDNENMS